MRGSDGLILAALGFAFALAFGSRGRGRNVPRPSPGPPGPSNRGINPATGNPIVTWGSGGKLSRAQIVELAKAHGFPDPERMTSYAMRESGGDPGVVVDTRGMSPDQLRAYWHKAASPELSIGLWQINVLASPQFDPELLKDPDMNATAAFTISNGGTDFSPWRQ